MKPSDAFVELARGLVATRLGLAFPETRRAEFEQRLRAAVPLFPLPHRLLETLAQLSPDAPELARLAHHFTVGETYFLRDHACFAALENHLLPALIARRRAQGALRLRLWSAGCATGEEAYSLAMLLDRLLPDLSQWSVTILGTDVSTAAIDTARRGVYRPWSLRQVAPRMVEHYFRAHADGTSAIRSKLRRMVTFEVLNLVGAAYPAALTNTIAMDVIVCRNVLMYFTPEAQRATIARLHQALAPGGWLVVAPLEASEALMRPLKPVSFPRALFFHKPAPLAVEDSPAYQGGARGDHEPVRRRPPHRPLPGQERDHPAPAKSASLSLVQRAEALANQGKLDEARALCERSLVGNALDAGGHFLLGTICQEQGDLPGAIAALRRCIYLAPDSARAHFVLGGLLQRLRKLGQAQRSFNTVIRILRRRPLDNPVEGTEGLTAGRLIELARAQVLAAPSAGPNEPVPPAQPGGQH